MPAIISAIVAKIAACAIQLSIRDHRPPDHEPEGTRGKPAPGDAPPGVLALARHEARRTGLDIRERGPGA